MARAFRGRNITRRQFIKRVECAAFGTVLASFGGRVEATAGTSDLCFQSATKLAQLIAAKTVSSEEVVTAYLARIAQVNPAINAVVTLCCERALEEARRAAMAIRASAVDPCTAFQ
jgi:amidase